MPPARHRWGAYNQGLRCLQPRRPSSPLTGSRGDGKGLVRAIVDLNWLTCNTTIPRPHSSDLQPLPPAARRQGSWGGGNSDLRCQSATGSPAVPRLRWEVEHYNYT